MHVSTIALVLDSTVTVPTSIVNLVAAPCDICGARNGTMCCSLRHAAVANPTVGSWLLYCSCPRCSFTC